MAWLGVRRALKALNSSVGTTVLIVIVLALGIGGVAALLAVVEGVWLRAVPYRDPGRLVLISVRTPSNSTGPVRWSDLAAWRASVAGSCGTMAAYGQARNIAVEINGHERSESIRFVEPSFFHVLGETPLAGRFFTDEDRGHGSATPILITEGLWRARFGATRDVDSLRVTVDGSPAVVIGVVPERIRSIQSSTIFRPLWQPTSGDDIWNLTVLARLRGDMSLAAAQRAFDVAATVRATDGQPVPRASLVRLRDAVLGMDVGRMLTLVLAVAALALFVACADVTLVVLGGMSRKGHELRIKMALGASRGRLIRELMSEGLLAALLGAALGLVLAAVTRDSLVALMPPTIPRAAEVQLGVVAVTGTILLSLAAGIATTLLPALWVFRMESHASVYATRTTSSHRRIGRLLTALQAVVTVVVLSLAAVLLRSYFGLARVDMGFDPRNVVRIEVVTTNGAYLRDEASLALELSALESLRRQLDVAAAGTTDQPPLGGSSATYSVTAVDASALGDETECYYRRVGPGYVEAMRMPVVKGRSFTAADARGAPDVVLVNETAARLFWRGADPLGRSIYTTSGRPLTVVGVVGDIRSEGLDRAAVPEVYRCRLQEPLGGAIVVVRTKGSPAPLLARLRGGVGPLPGLKVKSAGTLEEAIDRSVSEPRFRALVVGLFGVLVLVLSIAGVTGLSGRAVAVRTREIGTRMAIGASAGRCIRLLVWQTLWPVLAGCGVGALGAVWCSRLLHGLVFGVSEADPVSLVGAAVLAVAVASVAAYVPARRAALVDPVSSLRQD
jgi:predicted permease